MKEIDFVSSASCSDPRIWLKHQTLMQDYQDLRKVIWVLIEISGFLVLFRFPLDLVIWVINCSVPESGFGIVRIDSKRE